MDDDEHSEFVIEVANLYHVRYAPIISQKMEESARARGTGISKRSVEELIHYMLEGNAIIATDGNGAWAGFCYLAVWDNGVYISNSGLIVAPEFRDQGSPGNLSRNYFR